MLHKIRLILTLFVISLIQSTFFSELAAAQSVAHQYDGKPAIKMLTFNTGGIPDQKDPKNTIEFRHQRWRNLARYAKQHGVEVIVLQEVDYEGLPGTFAEVGYPMYEVHPEGVKAGSVSTMILSKYPFVPNTATFWDLGDDKQRYPNSVYIQTPYGPLRVVNIHTHFKFSCVHAARIFEAYTNPNNPHYSPPGEAIIIAGDFNVFFDKFNPVSSRNCQGTAQEEVRLQNVVPLTKLACTDTLNCSNTANRFIDLFFSLQSSSAQIYQTWVDISIQYIYNGTQRHPPVVAMVGSSSWNIIPTTPNPIVTPTPTPMPMISSGKLKVMSFNILNQNDGQHELRKIAEYIKSQNVEVAGIQELSTTKNAAAILDAELKAIGYPMHVAVSPNKAPKYFENAVFSKYPIVDAQYIGQNPCNSSGECTRWAVIAKINSSIGPIRFVSTHVHHGDDNCSSLAQFHDIVSPYFSEPLILTGDFNATLAGCGGALNNAYNSSCTETGNCVSGNIIDWVFLPKNNSLLQQSWRMQDKSFTQSDHFPIIAEIRSMVSLKQGDLDSDRDVDIFDYNLLLGKFGASGTAGFHAADIIQNGAVDIFDYNKLIENFGK
ncbi:hypothetical protein KA078_02855 [Candidatus Woesebacteria bacterium]|nr:hypothetical protein [Candidatus Woesebacteria bacterium]